MGQRDPALEHEPIPPEQSFPGELLEAFLRLTPDASVVVDDEGTIVSANEQAEALFGYEPGGLRGHEVEVLVPERLRHEHRSYRAGYMAHRGRGEMGAGLDLTGRRRDGSEFPVDISLAPLAGQERPLVVAAVRDSSERRAAHATAAELAAIVRSTVDGIVSISPEGILTSWNPGAERLFEWTSPDIVGTHVSALVPEGESAALEELLAAALAERASPPKDTRSADPRRTLFGRCRVGVAPTRTCRPIVRIRIARPRHHRTQAGGREAPSSPARSRAPRAAAGHYVRDSSLASVRGSDSGGRRARVCTCVRPAGRRPRRCRDQGW